MSILAYIFIGIAVVLEIVWASQSPINWVGIASGTSFGIPGALSYLASHRRRR